MQRQRACKCCLNQRNKYNQKTRKTELLLLNKMKINLPVYFPVNSKPKTVKIAPLHLVDLTTTNYVCVISSIPSYAWPKSTDN